ncbi:MAG: 50S ribosomal protein L17 [Chloroflexi bacterium]|nr:50S ribosomal protein L17 [Chloroflexota bacterium]
MRHRVDGRHFKRHTGARLALYRGLVRSLLLHEKIKTTDARAKEIAGMAHKLITLGKVGDLHSRRLIIAALGGDQELASKVIDVLGPRFKERPGGYTRRAALGTRVGDAAPMVMLELVD